ASRLLGDGRAHTGARRLSLALDRRGRWVRLWADLRRRGAVLGTLGFDPGPRRPGGRSPPGQRPGRPAIPRAARRRRARVRARREWRRLLLGWQRHERPRCGAGPRPLGTGVCYLGNGRAVGWAGSHLWTERGRRALLLGDLHARASSAGRSGATRGDRV